MPTSPSVDSVNVVSLAERIKRLDDELSKRELELDPAGYFVIFVDRERTLIVAKHFGTVINERGLATDPETGEVIPARGPVSQQAQQTFTGRTAKELCVQLFENQSSPLVSQWSHAAYLGREFQRAEAALVNGTDYVQD